MKFRTYVQNGMRIHKGEQSIIYSLLPNIIFHFEKGYIYCMFGIEIEILWYIIAVKFVSNKTEE